MKLLQDFVTTEITETLISESSFYVLRDCSGLARLDGALDGRNSSINLNLKCPLQALVPLRLEVVGKGRVSPNSIICIPTEADLTSYKSTVCRTPLVEQPHSDCNERKRKALQSHHHLEKKKLRRSWKKTKNRLQEMRMTSVVSSGEQAPDPTKLKALQERMESIAQARRKGVQDYNKQIRELWAPAGSSIRYSCSREIIGFAVAGGFSFRSGGFVGCGFAPAQALLQRLTQLGGRIVLLREPTSSVYSFAKMSVQEI